jgi:hypothetical protein
MKTFKQKAVIPTEEETTTKLSPMSKVVDSIKEAIEEGMDAGTIDATEALGNLSMAALTELYQNGLLDDKQAFTFLNSMAIKKTPAPVQRIEQHTKMDLRVIFNEIVEDNEAQREKTLAQSKVWNSEVMERLKLNENMELAPLDQDSASPLQEELPTPPPEIEDIKLGGDGSEKRQEWKKQYPEKVTRWGNE